MTSSSSSGKAGPIRANSENTCVHDPADEELVSATESCKQASRCAPDVYYSEAKSKQAKTLKALDPAS